ncbi:MAG: DUF488 family protein [Bacteroidales bacterium]
MLHVKIKRIYDEPADDDGYRILVDRLWPRGISKEEAKLDEWNKEIAPSTELRKWFDHKEDRFKEFAKCYHEELKNNEGDLDHLRKSLMRKLLRFCMHQKNPELNQAVVLRDVLFGRN